MKVVALCSVCGKGHRSKASVCRECVIRSVLDAPGGIDTIRQRIMSKIDDSTNPDGCWPWTADRNEDGYGRAWIGIKGSRGVLTGAHRASWEIFRGSIPDGMCVLHKCDNPPCCNPEHLFLGTNAENVADRMAKGRDGAHKRRGDLNFTRMHPERLPRGDASWQRLKPECLARGDANGSRTHPERLRRGESVTHSKLTNQAVIEIRRMRAEGMKPHVLAERYGVSPTLVRAVCARIVWKHVP